MEVVDPKLLVILWVLGFMIAGSYEVRSEYYQKHDTTVKGINALINLVVFFWVLFYITS